MKTYTNLLSPHKRHYKYFFLHFLGFCIFSLLTISSYIKLNYLLVWLIQFLFYQTHFKSFLHLIYWGFLSIITTSSLRAIDLLYFTANQAFVAYLKLKYILDFRKSPPLFFFLVPMLSLFNTSFWCPSSLNFRGSSFVFSITTEYDLYKQIYLIKWLNF